MGSVILNGARVGAGSIIAAMTLVPERTVIPAWQPLHGPSRQVSAAPSPPKTRNN